jgi:hypothetical protein
VNNLLHHHSVEQTLAGVFESTEYLPGTDIRASVNATAPAFDLRPEFFVTADEARS